MIGFQFLKAICRMIIFGIYPEYKLAKIKIFEQRVQICYSCKFYQTVRYNKDVLVKDRCVKGTLYGEHFDTYENAKYEKNKCPINKW